MTEERDRLEAERDALAEEVRALREQAAGRRPQRSGELVHVPRSTSVVMWSPRTARERSPAAVDTAKTNLALQTSTPNPAASFPAGCGFLLLAYSRCYVNICKEGNRNQCALQSLGLG